MKKKFLFSLFVFIAIFSLVGCGNNTNNGNDNKDNGTNTSTNTKTDSKTSSNPTNLKLVKDTNEGPIITGPQKYNVGDTVVKHRDNVNVREIIVLNSEGKYVTSTNVNSTVKDASYSYYEIYPTSNIEYSGSIKENGKEYKYTIVIYNMNISNAYNFFNKYDIFNTIKTDTGMTGSKLFDLTLKDIYNKNINDALLEAIKKQNKTLSDVATTKTTGVPDQIDTLVSDKLYSLTKPETFVTASLKIIFDK